MKWYVVREPGTEPEVYEVPDGAPGIGINAPCPACSDPACLIDGIGRNGSWVYRSGCGEHAMPFPHVYGTTIVESPTSARQAERVEP